MNILKPKTWFSKNHIETKSTTKVVDLSPGSFLEFAFGGAGWVTDAQAHEFYRTNSSVATAIDMIAGAIEQIDPVIQMPDGTYIDKHPMLDLLNKPNGFHNIQNFMGNVARNYLLKHDSIITSAGNVNAPPIEMYPIAFQNVSVLQAMDDFPQSYFLTRGTMPGQYVRFEENRKIGTRFYDGPLKELYHIKGYSSRYEQTESDSPLQAAALEAKQMIKGKYHNIQVLDNGGRLSLLIAFKDDDEIDDDQHRDRIQKINEQYGGSANAGKIGVISNADIAEIKEMGVNNKDMDFVNLEDMASKSIYMRYQIPLALVTIEASTFNNQETGVERLYDDAVLPNADIIFAGLTDLLSHRFKLMNGEILTYNPESINALKQRTLKEVDQRKKINIETSNELRSLLPGREPLEGGDTLYQAANLVPVGEDLFTDDNNAT